MLRPVFLLALVAVIASGCSGRKVWMLTDERFEPSTPPDQISLYINEIERPHIKLAYVESDSDSREGTEVTRTQLTQLRERAHEIGADAVVNVRQLKTKVRGAVIDERVPFRAYRQGSFELGFIRGVAIRYVEEGEAEDNEPVSAPDDASLAEAGEPQGIPEQETLDREPLRSMGTVPQGLGPRR